MKSRIFFLLLISIGLFMSSCERIEPKPKYLTVNGVDYKINWAYMDDYGTDYDISYREYELNFKSSETLPSSYINFTLYSTDTRDLEEGVYIYEMWAESQGTIDYLEVGAGIEYDSKGFRVDGIALSESNATFSGSVTIAWNNNDWDFLFDLEATRKSDNKTFKIGGRYNANVFEDI